MKKGEAPVIYGDGTQTRDFIYVKDVVDSCNLAMNSDIGCDIFNIGTGENYSLNHIIDLLNEMLGTSIKPKYIENQIKNYVQDTLADTTKARNGLEFKAKYSLKDGIKEIII